MARREIKNPAEGLFNTSSVMDLPDEHEPLKQHILKNSNSDPGAAESALVSAPPAKEARTLRKQIVLPPSLGLKAEQKSRALGISLNEAVNQLIARWVEGE